MQMSLAVKTALMSLHSAGEISTEPFRVLMAGKVTHCPFDKTGTLTTDELVPAGVVNLADSLSKAEAIPVSSVYILHRVPLRFEDSTDERNCRCRSGKGHRRSCAERQISHVEGISRGSPLRRRIYSAVERNSQPRACRIAASWRSHFDSWMSMLMLPSCPERRWRETFDALVSLRSVARSEQTPLWSSMR